MRTNKRETYYENNLNIIDMNGLCYQYSKNKQTDTIDVPQETNDSYICIMVCVVLIELGLYLIWIAIKMYCGNKIGTLFVSVLL